MDKVKDLVRAHWERRAPSFDQEPSHGLLNDKQAEAWRGLVQGIAGVRPLDILDVGCGTGFLSVLLAEQGHRVTGVDFAPAMLSEAGSKAAARGLAINFVEADIEALDLPAASLDLIIERHVLWTLPHPAETLKSWRDLLRKGGRVALIEGHWRMEPREEYIEMHERLPLFGGKPEAEIANLVRSQGFPEVEIRPLMDPALWTAPPPHPRYLVIATR